MKKKIFIVSYVGRTTNQSGRFYPRIGYYEAENEEQAENALFNDPTVESQHVTKVEEVRAPDKALAHSGNLYVMAVDIPQTYTKSETVYFVSGLNGDEYGQHATKGNALLQFGALKELSLEELKRLEY